MGKNRQHKKRKTAKNQKTVKCCIGPITLLVIGALLATMGLMAGELIGYFDFRCQMDMIECCGPTHINFDEELLHQKLHKYIYGQHIAIDKVYDAVTNHHKNNAGKALVMSFHGWTGTGKNYVSRRLVESKYRRGAQSSFVHVFSSQMDFPDKSQVHLYQERLREIVPREVARCRHATFIFDEADHMPSGLVDTLLPFINCTTCQGIDFSQVMFIFLSNVGSNGFADELINTYREGKERASIQMDNIHDHLFRRAFFDKNAYRDSKLLSTEGRVDVFVPFFPLERRHVRLCIRDAIEELDASLVNNTELYTELTQHIHWFPDHLLSETQFSNSGCKKLKQKLRTIVGTMTIDEL